MTGWIEEKARQRHALQVQTAKIKANALAIWKALWDAVGEVAEEYQQRFPHSAEPHEYIDKGPFTHDTVWLEVLYGPAPVIVDRNVKRKLTLTLDQKNCTIRESCKGQVFRIGVGGNGDVCLMDAAGGISLDEAAERIMAPFLFPDLEESARGATT